MRRIQLCKNVGGYWEISYRGCKVNETPACFQSLIRCRSFLFRLNCRCKIIRMSFRCVSFDSRNCRNCSNSWSVVSP
jgi:hypothetical protein